MEGSEARMLTSEITQLCTAGGKTLGHETQYNVETSMDLKVNQAAAI